MISLIIVLAFTHVCHDYSPLVFTTAQRSGNTYKSSIDIELEYVACILAHVSPGETSFQLLPI
jgi:hypothetical protein